MKFQLTALCLLCVLLACGTGSAPEKEKTETAAPVDEDDLLVRLSMLLLPQPQTQAQIDQNLIVNYAIEELLDVRATPSGLFYQILEKGTSDDDLPPRWGDVMVIHYTGTFLDGRVFDASKAGKPLRIKLKQVIPGWQEALQMMHKGDKGFFLLPSHLAYGEKGFGKAIPPNTVLKFEVELVDIDRY